LEMHHTAETSTTTIKNRSDTNFISLKFERPTIEYTDQGLVHTNHLREIYFYNQPVVNQLFWQVYPIALVSIAPIYPTIGKPTQRPSAGLRTPLPPRFST
jgi:hypothetical protein